MRMKVVSPLTAIVAAAAIAGCGGGGGGGSSAGTSSDGQVTGAVAAAIARYFPTTPGSRWVYSSTSGATVTTTIVGTQAVSGGATGTVFQTLDSSDNSTTLDIFTISDAGARDFAAPGSAPIIAALSGVVVIPDPSQVGVNVAVADVTADSGMDLDGDGKTDNVRMQVTLLVVGLENVLPSAFVFKNALRVRTTVLQTYQSSRGLPPVDVTLTVDDWYAENIGRVETLTRVTGPGVDSTEAEALTAYHVGNLSSDSTLLREHAESSRRWRPAMAVVSSLRQRRASETQGLRSGTLETRSSPPNGG